MAAAIHAAETHRLGIVLVQYLFLRHGRPIVFIGRFVMLLRVWEGFLAGADAMPWREFAPVNAGAIVLWACVWGLGAYAFGQTSKGLMERFGIGIFVVVAVILIVGGIYFRRHEEAHEAKADQALPGPLQRHCAPRGSQTDLEPMTMSARPSSWSGRWQRIACRASTSSNAGASRSQIAPILRGQRVWNTQPDGGWIGLGISPLSTIRCASGWPGIAESSASV